MLNSRTRFGKYRRQAALAAVPRQGDHHCNEIIAQLYFDTALDAKTTLV